ncbi:Arc family DNA-binding protein [Agrobacterium pusense]|uniref:Arc family DNA-binding protein n=1 Tax=Agrobacterium pusense TaxID=648995 RepID=UPI000D1A8AC0|nr:Arc family DNA-binding protein [Agrobacterium pusense]
MKQQDPQLRLRIPENVKDWVKEKADANRRSMTSEIVFVLETAMKMEKAEARS